MRGVLIVGTGKLGATGPAGPAGAAGPAGSAGAAGAPGSKWFADPGVPTGALGVVGDFYLNISNGTVYEKTGATTWTLRDNLTGPAGATGPAGPAGPTGPANVANYLYLYDNFI